MISATEVGTAVPQSCRVSFYSLHEHVINLQDVETGLLISIVTRTADMTAMSIRISAIPETLRIIGMGQDADTTVRIADGELVAGSQTPPFITWTDAVPRFTGNLRSPRARRGGMSREPSTVSRLSDLRDRLMQSGSRDGLLTAVLGGEPSNIYARRASEILSSSLPVAERLAELPGLGPGFTPSGDDFICGALAADTLFASPASRLNPEPIRRRLGGSAGETSRRVTTPGGTTLVTLACERSFPRYLVSFLDLVFSSGGDTTAALRDGALKQVLGHGASSGTDTLAGFIWMAGQLAP